MESVVHKATTFLSLTSNYWITMSINVTSKDLIIKKYKQNSYFRFVGLWSSFLFLLPYPSAESLTLVRLGINCKTNKKIISVM